MLLRTTDPFRDFDRLTSQLLGSALGTTNRPAVMPMDAWRQGDEFVLEFDLPGVSRESIDIDVERNVLTIKAERVIQNGKTHTVRLERARFELFGAPIAFLPVLELPDPTVKRKSGFLFPRMATAENLGFGLSIPYYQTLTPHMDATLTVTGYLGMKMLGKSFTWTRAPDDLPRCEGAPPPA